MTYKELTTIAEYNGYKINNDINCVILTKYQEQNTIKISKLKENLIFPDMHVCFYDDLETLKASLECAETPLDERYPEKKYYICSRLIPDSNFKYLCKRCGSIDELEFDVESNIDSKFTQAEIDEIKEEYDVDLKDFEIIGVE